MLVYSSGICGAVLAALVPGVNIIKVLLLGLGILKDEATVKSMSRFGDHRFEQQDLLLLVQAYLIF